MLLRFVALYALIYGAYGVASPFMPAFLEQRGLVAEQLGVLFGCSTAIRLVSGPLCGRLADVTGAVRGVLAICAMLAAIVAAGLLASAGYCRLLVLSLVQAAALAPITVLADALAVSTAGRAAEGDRFEYGWVRGAGSAAFILGTLISGQVVGVWGLASVLMLQAPQLVLAAGAALLVPAAVAAGRVHDAARADSAGGFRRVLMIPEFRRITLISALVLGSHAIHDTFAAIRWTRAGVAASTVGVLWSESVAAEVVVFLFIGPTLVTRVGPGRVMALAATAGVARWVVAASTTTVTPLALVQPLHGLTFAALHLACMRVIPRVVPPGLAATAQAIYAVGAGAATAVLMLVSGHLYAHLGGQAFLVMALLCAFAIPVALRSHGNASSRHVGKS